MSDGGGCSRIGSSTLTGLVREEATLRTVDDRSDNPAAEACKRRLRGKRTCEDLSQNRTELGQVHHADDSDHHDINSRHNRCHPFGHASHGLNSTENHHCREDKEQCCDDQVRTGKAAQSRQRFAARGAERTQKSRCDRVGLHGGDDERTGHNRDDSKNACQNLILHASCNVVGRATAEGSISRTNLEDLRKCGLEKGGRHTDQSNNPHPEDRTWTAHEQRNGHAKDVTDAHACGQGNRECLEGGNPTLCAIARTRN